MYQFSLISVLDFAVSDFDAEYRRGPSWSGTSFANICPERRFVRDGIFSGGQLFRGAGITLVDGEEYILNCHESRRGILSIEGSTFQSRKRYNHGGSANAQSRDLHGLA